MATEAERTDATDSDAVPAPVPTASAVLERFTGEALAYAWRLLIPTFGLSLVYVNFHFAMRYMGGVRAFAPFGQLLRFGTPMMRDLFVWLEIVAMIVLDLLALTTVLLVVILIAAIVWASTNPIEATAIFGDAFVTSIRSIH